MGLVTGKEDNPPPSSLALAQGSARIISSNGSFASAEFAPVNKSGRAAPLSPKNSEAGSNNNIRPGCAKIQLNLLCTFMDLLFCTKSLAVQEYTRRPSRRLPLSGTSSSSPHCGHPGDASSSWVFHISPHRLDGWICLPIPYHCMWTMPGILNIVMKIMSAKQFDIHKELFWDCFSAPFS